MTIRAAKTTLLDTAMSVTWHSRRHSLKRRTLSATPTSARRTFTPVGRSTPSSSAITITGPADAYKYFKGETIKHPLGYDIKITTPLDWAGVTDHSEYVGTVRLAQIPTRRSASYPLPSKLQVHDAADVQRIYLWLGTAIDQGRAG